jgi:hypothetical protein
MKLYEVLLRKIGWVTDTVVNQPAEKPEEEKVYNPLGSKVNGVVNIDNLDYRDHRFTVKEIKEYSIGLGGSNHKMVDYVLQSRPIGKPDLTVRLRVVPNPDAASRITHRALVLELYDELAYNEGLHDVVRDDTKKFIVDDDKDDENPDNDTHDEFWRVNDVGISYVSNVKTLADTDGDGTVRSNEIQKSQIEFWDYSRITEQDGVDLEQFLFVEMNKKDGWFQIWKGAEVIPERIEVF